MINGFPVVIGEAKTPVRPSDYGKRPLSKLTRDILDELGVDLKVFNSDYDNLGSTENVFESLSGK